MVDRMDKGLGHQFNSGYNGDRITDMEITVGGIETASGTQI